MSRPLTHIYHLVRAITILEHQEWDLCRRGRRRLPVSCSASLSRPPSLSRLAPLRPRGVNGRSVPPARLVSGRPVTLVDLTVPSRYLFRLGLLLRRSRLNRPCGGARGPVEGFRLGPLLSSLIDAGLGGD